MKQYNVETVNCPLCHSSRYELYIENAKELYNNLDEYFNVTKCIQCTHIFTNPRPTQDTIEYFYPNTAGYYQPPETIMKQGFPYEVYKKILNIFYGYHLESKSNFLLASIVGFLKKRQIETSHMPRYIKNGKLLDIGCSYGSYLHKLNQLGWNVYGTEINEKAIAYAKKEFNLINIENNFFENTKFEDLSFDVINLNMVLEHMYDPHITMDMISKILKDKGQLILSVPDIKGFESSVYKQYAYGLQVPEHLHHYSPKTIKTLLSKHGFIIEKIVHHNFDRDLVASAGYMQNKRLSNFLKNKFIRTSVVKIFVWFLALIGKTSRMSIYAKKL